MSHEIDITTGRAAIAYVGDPPWHGLGQSLTPGLSIERWQVEAGLNWSVSRRQVEYLHDDLSHQYPDRSVLVRSDTGAPLSIVGRRYKIVQPADIMDFFARLSRAGGFELETAGSLSGGQKIWALAKIGEGADIVGQDRVAPYLLLATSFDGTLSTMAKFTAVRVVCNNTLSIAASAGGSRHARSLTSVSIPHSTAFKPELIRERLGLATSAWSRFKAQAEWLSSRPLDVAKVNQLTFGLVDRITPPGDGIKPRDIHGSRGYQRIMDLFEGQAIGSDLTGGKTAWQWLNSVTQWVDHERGRTADTRMQSAWFGQGDGIKRLALTLATETI